MSAVYRRDYVRTGIATRADAPGCRTQCRAITPVRRNWRSRLITRFSAVLSIAADYVCGDAANILGTRQQKKQCSGHFAIRKTLHGLSPIHARRNRSAGKNIERKIRGSSCPDCATHTKLAMSSCSRVRKPLPGQLSAGLLRRLFGTGRSSARGS